MALALAAALWSGLWLDRLVDGLDVALAVQLADDRWVGRQGSIHLGLTASQGLARNGQGQLSEPARAKCTGIPTAGLPWCGSVKKQRNIAGIPLFSSDIRRIFQTTIDPLFIWC